MKKILKIIAIVLAVIIAGTGSFVIYKSSQGISYDISSVENIGSNLELIKEDDDSVTLKAKSDKEFKIMMFTDTHLNGKKGDSTTVSYIVKNITEQKPDLVIFGGDNVSSGFNKKRNIELAQLMENLGVYWAAVMGNHEGEGVLAVSREENIGIFTSYDHCIMKQGKEDVDGAGNFSVTILNADNTVKEVLFFMDSGSYMSDELKEKYGITDTDDVYDGVKESQVEWYKTKHDSIEAEYGKFRSVAVMHIPPYQTEEGFEGSPLIYGEKREGICESGFDSGIFDAMKEKGSTQAIYFGHDHVNDFGYIYEGITLSYIQSSGYSVYGMESKFDAPESEWIQGCTLLNIKDDGTYTTENIFNHK